MSNRLILITGTSGEIGSYITNEFVKQDWNVIGLDRKVLANPFMAEKFTFFLINFLFIMEGF